VLRARDVPGRKFLGLADVDDHGAVIHLLADGGRVHFLDPALYLA
jgi:hypothetical protein